MTAALLRIVPLPRPAAGEFDRLEGDALAKLDEGRGVETTGRLSFADIEGLPAVLADTRAAFLVVKTGQGNLTRMLVTPAFRKSPEGETGGDGARRGREDGEGRGDDPRPRPRSVRHVRARQVGLAAAPGARA